MRFVSPRLPLHNAVFIATPHCGAPARRRAFADERRVIVGDTGRRVPHRRSSASLAVSFARLEPEQIKRSSHRCAHRHLPVRCVARCGRWSMSGAS
jgi:hypothetical protein